MDLKPLGLYAALAIVGALFVGALATSFLVMVPMLNAIYLGLYADFFGPFIGAVEVASQWCEAHPLAVWAAGIMTLCVLFVGLNEVDFSDDEVLT